MLMFITKDIVLIFMGLSVLSLCLSLVNFNNVNEQTLLIAVGLTASLIITGLLSVLLSIFIERMTLSFKDLTPSYCSIYDDSFLEHERFWKLGAAKPLVLFNGTPLKSFFLRLQGLKGGKRLFDNGGSYPEPSMVTMGDDCTINYQSVIQCHSLEDGVFKSDVVNIHSHCNLGCGAFLQYGTVLENGAVIEANGVLMKGTTISTNTTWVGNPAREES